MLRAVTLILIGSIEAFKSEKRTEKLAVALPPP
jgi:hypothetical protein